MGNHCMDVLCVTCGLQWCLRGCSGIPLHAELLYRLKIQGPDFWARVPSWLKWDAEICRKCETATVYDDSLLWRLPPICEDCRSVNVDEPCFVCSKEYCYDCLGKNHFHPEEGFDVSTISGQKV